MQLLRKFIQSGAQSLSRNAPIFKPKHDLAVRIRIEKLRSRILKNRPYRIR